MTSPQLPQPPIPWSICVHMQDVQADPTKAYNRDTNPFTEQRAGEVLNYVKSLGCSGVRLDVDWALVYPTRLGGPDHAMVAYYRRFCELARSMDLSVIATLFHPPKDWIPQMWNVAHRGRNPFGPDLTSFFAAWGAFCKRMASTLGDNVQDFVLWNEPNNHPPNNPLYNASPLDPVPTNAEYGRLFGEAARVIALHKPNARCWINMNCNANYWVQSLTSYMQELKRYPEHGRVGIAIDHYPGAWVAEGGWENWGPLDSLFQLICDSAPDHPCHGRAGAVMETGMPTRGWVPARHWSSLNEETQRAWIKSSLPALKQAIRRNRDRYGEKGKNIPAFCSYYTLIDANSDANHFWPWNNLEPTFGVIYTNRWTKPSYTALQEVLSTFSKSE